MRKAEGGKRKAEGGSQKTGPEFRCFCDRLRCPKWLAALRFPLSAFRLPPSALLVVLLCGCAGYQVGNWSLYPSHIQTVYVPVFQSASFRRNLAERLTEAVMKQIEQDTPYKVVSTPDADSILTGEIVTDTKRVLVENRLDEPRDVEYALVVHVRWADRRGEVLREGPPIALPPEVIGVTGRADLVPEFGQSVATASQEAIRRAAKQIVAMMEMPW